MCGILCVLDIKSNSDDVRRDVLKNVKKIRHRGPDWSGIFSNENAVLAHERLAIVDIETGAQPLYDDKKRVLAVNGEIYNHLKLREQLHSSHVFHTNSDCEVILHLYDEMGKDFLNQLNGIFAFVLYDPSTKEYLIARDHIGIVPLYIGRDGEGTIYIASEMKAIIDMCPSIEEFPPGHYLSSKDKTYQKYYRPEWEQITSTPSRKLDLEELKNQLEKAVIRQLMCDVPYGLLISGGVDSSIVAAIAAKYSQKRVETGNTKPAWWPQLHSFSVGLEGSPDLAAATKVADYIGSIHHEIYFTVQQGLDAISDVIYHLETFDVTTIRAATPMYLMARKIKSMGIKMILSGEGADEIFGGYLYFHKAPNAQAFFEETVRKMQKLHLFDCLRANKSTAAWGLEARVPFLDKEFVDYAMTIDPNEKMTGPNKMEKHILRKAFEGYVPKEILWRQKEQFSDGVGYGWIDYLKQYTNEQIEDSQLQNAQYKFPSKTPKTKEEYWYRSIFEKHFPHPSAVKCVPFEPSVACSTPIALEWDQQLKNMVDPSGRAVAGIHSDSYKKK